MLYETLIKFVVEIWIFGRLDSTDELYCLVKVNFCCTSRRKLDLIRVAPLEGTARRFCSRFLILIALFSGRGEARRSVERQKANGLVRTHELLNTVTCLLTLVILWLLIRVTGPSLYMLPIFHRSSL
jgi:hypothetical protein